LSSGLLPAAILSIAILLVMFGPSDLKIREISIMIGIAQGKPHSLFNTSHACVAASSCSFSVDIRVRSKNVDGTWFVLDQHMSWRHNRIGNHLVRWRLT
jgi:hypothetical protein